MSSSAPATAIPGQDAESLYRAVASRDRRFDGRFVLGVTSTGIYCRPSCPARTPKPENVRYFALPAAAVAAGFRACRRCRPERIAARPHIADETGVVDRALSLIGQGTVDDVGVGGLAQRLAVSERHLHRMLVASVGTGALALAQTRRAQTARTLLEQTALPVTDVAFAAGFGSLRQFNDVMRLEYGASPTELRRRPATPDRPADGGSLALRLTAMTPWDGRRLLAFLGSRAVAGVETFDGRRYTRTYAAPEGTALMTLEAKDDALHVQLTASELAVIGPAMATVRRLCDLGADIEAIEAGLGRVPLMRSLVRARPGLRVPGAVGGWEILVRAVVGQQVSVAAARTLLGRIVARSGPKAERVTSGGPEWALFPPPRDVLAADLGALGLTTRRVATLRSVAEAAVSGALLLEPGDDLLEARKRLMALPGVGPWTTEYVATRALGDPDAWPGTDLVLARAASEIDTDQLSPWRAYAALHLWTQHSEEKA